MLGLPRPQLLAVDRLGEAAAGGGIGDQDGLVVGEDLGRLGHEVDAAEHDRRRLDLGGDPRQPERVAHVVGDVLDLGHLVVVGEDDRVALLASAVLIFIEFFASDRSASTPRAPRKRGGRAFLTRGGRLPTVAVRTSEV
jgi:hypothetical protein